MSALKPTCPRPPMMIWFERWWRSSNRGSLSLHCLLIRAPNAEVSSLRLRNWMASNGWIGSWLNSTIITLSSLATPRRARRASRAESQTPVVSSVCCPCSAVLTVPLGRSLSPTLGCRTCDLDLLHESSFLCLDILAHSCCDEVHVEELEALCSVHSIPCRQGWPLTCSESLTLCDPTHGASWAHFTCVHGLNRTSECKCNCELFVMHFGQNLPFWVAALLGSPAVIVHWPDNQMELFRVKMCKSV